MIDQPESDLYQRTKCTFACTNTYLRTRKWHLFAFDEHTHTPSKIIIKKKEQKRTGWWRNVLKDQHHLYWMKCWNTFIIKWVATFGASAWWPWKMYIHLQGMCALPNRTSNVNEYFFPYLFRSRISVLMEAYLVLCEKPLEMDLKNIRVARFGSDGIFATERYEKMPSSQCLPQCGLQRDEPLGDNYRFFMLFRIVWRN